MRTREELAAAWRVQQRISRSCASADRCDFDICPVPSIAEEGHHCVQAIPIAKGNLEVAPHDGRIPEVNLSTLLQLFIISFELLHCGERQAIRGDVDAEYEVQPFCNVALA